ncbi:MAG: glucokinase [Burkholderiales bacterium]
MPEAPCLVADVGGTHARFALAVPGERIAAPDLVVDCASHTTIEAAIEVFLDSHGVRPQAACLAVAGPVNGDQVSLTNGPWRFSTRELRHHLGLDRLLVINDFAALARGLPALGAAETVAIGAVGGRRNAGLPMAVLGPGTGLGIAGLVPGPAGPSVVAGEGGHAGFAPRDDLEDELLKRLRRDRGHVSNEMLLSGPGVLSLYRALAEVRGVAPRCATPAEVSTHGLGDGDLLAREALEVFCAVLGSVAGDVALTFGARGGVFIGGGIAPRLLPLLEIGRFRERFEDKGVQRNYVAGIPVRVIIGGAAALNGALAALAT